jgi:putative tricarboxylic transport membrane protein
LIGMDPSVGSPRFTFGQVHLLGGLEFIPVIMGLFGVAEIFENLEKSMVQVFKTKISSLIPTTQDTKDSVWPIIRGTVVGFFLGLIPGTNTVIASFMSYLIEKKLCKHPEKFGTGAIEGVAGPETANNAFATSALIPLFTLGIPGSAVMALLLGTFMMHGVIPGPLLFRDHPELIWTVIASLYIGNVILLVLNLPLIGVWVRVLNTPYPILLTLILLFTVIGAYCVNSTSFDVGVMVLFGALGYLFKKLDFPVAPLVLTLILGPLMEKGLRLSLELSQGDFMVFLTRPISATLLVSAALIILLSAVRFKPFRSSALRGDAQL